MNIRSAVFQTSAPDLASCPPSERPEFAFIGRSNVGKSSMINMLTNRADLAKVSSVPGKTSLINFFTINGRWSLVDLPGYGYAKAGRKERGRFSAAIADYLQQRPNLVGTFVLIDSLLDPQKIDLEFLEWMVGAGLPFVLVFTKADRLSETAARKSIEAFMERLGEISSEYPDFVIASAKQRLGQKKILETIALCLEEEQSA